MFQFLSLGMDSGMIRSLIQTNTTKMKSHLIDLGSFLLLLSVVWAFESEQHSEISEIPG